MSYKGMSFGQPLNILKGGNDDSSYHKSTKGTQLQDDLINNIKEEKSEGGSCSSERSSDEL
jgi:hypothetical protein